MFSNASTVKHKVNSMKNKEKLFFVEVFDRVFFARGCHRWLGYNLIVSGDMGKIPEPVCKAVTTPYCEVAHFEVVFCNISVLTYLNAADLRLGVPLSDALCASGEMASRSPRSARAARARLGWRL